MKKALQLAISVAKPASRAPPVTAVVAAHPSSSSSWSTFTRPSWTAASVSVGGGIDPLRIKSTPQFSPGATSGAPFPRALDAAFPGVRNMIGIVAGPTPFVTGKPFTLFADDGEVKESGFVGAALVRGTSKSGSDSEQKSVPITCKLTLPGWLRWAASIGDEAQGNVILDRRVYAGLSLQPGEQPFLLTDITAGDPSRGFLALATHLAVQPGWAIQFFESQSSEA
ncbi:hypothetical protein BCR44DRAFT_1501966 [Catenaria anguillulae PL171]|uniref:Uncharacterized protein n=1 Tax=Catenaria anguillulae PL171 TaxID=765915 RepID=A0A1Y2HFS4_9FUNG|nr:hypothetical protein BCR44DRAFT_1501966 [Catenaria anguillulae PL171]